MSRIKYTIVPKQNLEACIFESGVRLSEADIIIDPIIVFNANMELGIETEIYGEDMNEDNFKFAKESNLLNLLTEVNDAEVSNTIIVNGFNKPLCSLTEVVIFYYSHCLTHPGIIGIIGIIEN